MRLEEPQKQPKFAGKQLIINNEKPFNIPFDNPQSTAALDHFLNEVERPLVIVSTLKSTDYENVVAFLLALGAPVLLEGISGLREEPRLQKLRIRRTEKILEAASQAGYAVDGVLRIGGVPTHRIWRDLEYRQGDIQVCSISDVPFSGLSWNRRVICAPVSRFLATYYPNKVFDADHAGTWLTAERIFEQHLIELFNEEPMAEPSLIHALSKEISDGTHVYLGNSLPIRKWDLRSYHRKTWTHDER